MHKSLLFCYLLLCTKKPPGVGGVCEQVKCGCGLRSTSNDKRPLMINKEDTKYYYYYYHHAI